MTDERDEKHHIAEGSVDLASDGDSPDIQERLKRLFIPPIRMELREYSADMRSHVGAKGPDRYVASEINFTTMNGYVLVQPIHKPSSSPYPATEGIVQACESRSDQKLRAGYCVLFMEEDSIAFESWEEVFFLVHESKLLGAIPSFFSKSPVQGNPFGNPW